MYQKNKEKYKFVKNITEYLTKASTSYNIYTCFIRLHLDFGGVIYDQAYNFLLYQKLESIQYNAALAITGAIRCSSRE